MKSVFKKISWLVLGALIAITAIVYICPMAARGEPLVTKVSSDPCGSIGMAGSSMNNAVSCVTTHLTVIGQFLANVPQAINFFLALVLLAVAAGLVMRHLLTAIVRPLFNRLRRRYLFYQTSIKLLIEKRLLRYLGFLGNYTIVSFS